MAPKDVSDVMYKAALIKHLSEKEAKVDPDSVEVVKGIDLRTFKALPENVKEFVLSKHGQELLGGKYTTSREWELMKPTEKIMTLTELAKNADLLRIEKELRQAGAPRLTPEQKAADVTATTKARKDVEAEEFFRDPDKGYMDAINKHLNSKEVQNELLPYMGDPKKYAHAKTKIAEKKLRELITARGGEIQDMYLDGKTLVYRVKWPTGNVFEVRMQSYF